MTREPNRLEQLGLWLIFGPMTRAVLTPWIWLCCTAMAIVALLIAWRAESWTWVLVATYAVFSFGSCSLISRLSLKEFSQNEEWAKAWARGKGGAKQAKARRRAG